MNSTFHRASGLAITLLFVLVAPSTFGQETESWSTGFLHVSYDNVDSLYVYIPDLLDPISIANGDSISVIAGRHKVYFLHPFHLDTALHYEITEGQTTYVRLTYNKYDPTKYNRRSTYFQYFDLPSTLTVVTDLSSQIYVNGEAVGYGLAQISVEKGDYRIRTENPLAGSRSRTVHVDGLPTIELYNYPNRVTTYQLSWIPGAGQFYKNQPLRAILFSASVISLSGYAILNHTNYTSERTEYFQTLALYRGATDPLVAQELADLAEQQVESMNASIRARDVSLTLVSAVWIANIVDAIFSGPPGGYREMRDAPRVQVTAAPGTKLSTLGLTIIF